MAKCTELSKDNIEEALKGLDTVLTDCDGVLWNGPDVIPGAVEAIRKLRKRNKKVFFVTNNSTRTRDEYAEKLTKLGFEAGREDIICSAYVTAQYIRHQLGIRGKIFVVGSYGLQKELNNAGFDTSPIGPDPLQDSSCDWTDMPLDPDITAVVVGFDPHFSYAKMVRTCGHLSKTQIPLIATNDDPALPAKNDRIVPGTGAILHAIEIGSGRKALVCGKPYEPMLKVIIERNNVDPSKALVIGDRLETDIAMANLSNMNSLLVLSGCAALEDVYQLQSSVDAKDKGLLPSFYIKSLSSLNALLS